MPTQYTAPETFAEEMATIRAVVGLAADHPITYHDGGWDSRVYTFDEGQHFFKFPRAEKIQQRYHYEITALDFVAGLDTGIAAPRIMWRHPDNAYFGYRGVPGQILMECFDHIDTPAKKRIGTAIGTFLRQFHTLNVEEGRVRTVEDEIDQFQNWHQQHATVFEKNLTPAEHAKLTQLVRTTWPKTLHELGTDPVLCHGDVHFGNILYDTDGALGIIDFGDVGYCDRSKDFIGYEDAIVSKAALAAYGRTDHTFLERIAIRKKTLHIISVGFYAGKQDKAGLSAAFDALRSMLSE